MDIRCFAFGPFVLIPQRQVLLKKATPVRIGSRALDILTQLVQRSGEVVDKLELMAAVWAGTFVGESNLKVNVAAIRKVIDDDVAIRSRIATVVGRGYRFVEPVRELKIQCVEDAQGALSSDNWCSPLISCEDSFSQSVSDRFTQSPGYSVVAIVRSRGLFNASRKTTDTENAIGRCGPPGSIVPADRMPQETDKESQSPASTRGKMPRQYNTLTLAEAKQILAAAEAKAERLGIAYNIAVVDSGGHLLAFSRQDGALIGSIDLAIDKALTARLFDKTTSYLAMLAQSGKPLFGIQESNGGKVVVFGGGIPIVFAGEIIGAVGASAGTVEQDIAVVEAGVSALGAGYGHTSQ